MSFLVVSKLWGGGRSTGVREAIEAVGVKLLYLPPYSLDLNPIEKAFANLNAILRTAAKRTVPDL